MDGRERPVDRRDDMSTDSVLGRLTSNVSEPNWALFVWVLVMGNKNVVGGSIFRSAIFY